MIKKLLIVSIIFLITACNNQYKATGDTPKSSRERREESFGKLTGEEGVVIGGKKKRDTAGITVNAYLWRAALEAVNTMPISVVDPFSGVITTEWYQVDYQGHYRYKLNILISSDIMRADAVKVNVFEQKYIKSGWVDVMPNPKMAVEIEDRILTRARYLKLNN
ncbi:DUF3576 domain-containing protein [Rickettsiales endosymbiont of Stachyamoeba lipophora]|uniref:DUF3576 domain-containing protein n=1 Tax=Rickettsiales endosymbiont of Stachyamoeba lipophora TaxID=2486578 RepID=UPI000F645AEA|nr:DUF3576 domain-containing protein [Rickettsiales endosymbiont of Stachyamoeba lipophora]AZL16058.1 DUF3576 domain-containing protein [Rickettsiales endosymbiont of Stachyamoeba lipophora]